MAELHTDTLATSATNDPASASRMMCSLDNTDTSQLESSKKLGIQLEWLLRCLFCHWAHLTSASVSIELQVEPAASQSCSEFEVGPAPM